MRLIPAPPVNRNASLPYTPSEIVGTKHRGVYGIDDNQESTICTSHVERQPHYANADEAVYAVVAGIQQEA